MQLCILCHSPQSIDPESGNSVDMTEMIHKIHMGAQLPSVLSGTPYHIVGYGNHDYDYSKINFPQRIANCTACHESDKAEQANVYLTKPTIESCGSCHDRTWFGDPQQTPEHFTNHPFNFEQSDSSACATCHTATDEGVSPIGKRHAALTAPGLLMDVVSVTPNAETGELKISFKMTNLDGTPIQDATTPQRVGAIVAWPASDYQNSFTETLGGSRPVTGVLESTTSETGVYNYTFKTKLPVGATDTFAVALTGRLAVLDRHGEEVEQGTSDNGLTFFTLNGGTPTPRRDVVANERCDACHNEVRFHGEQRFGVEVCVMCHRPNASAEGETINFKEMLHYAHTGAKLENGYELGDWNVEEYNFPGKRETCTMCHIPGTFGVPLPSDAKPTVITDGETSEIVPATRAACTSCHDSVAADTHAFLASNAQGVESCAVCHGSTSGASVAAAHAVAP
jgi:OmcA/MtrC family decaheme c-type cytochrome